ncbi:MAG: hypothetical protein HY318_04210, partial [Armatimonadetes bacterium]|nr:hypothetical protein [Armatimonadota bacterium]
PATDKQLLNGIAVGEELLAKYQDRIGQTVPIWRKIWNMGFPQVASGSYVAYHLGQLALRVWDGAFHLVVK